MVHERSCITSRGAADTTTLLLPIQLVMEAGSEWKREYMVCLASDYVVTAFDSLTADQASTDFIASGMHPQLVAAIAQENCDLQIEPSFPDCPDADHVPFNKSIRQRGGDAVLLDSKCAASPCLFWCQAGRHAASGLSLMRILACRTRFGRITST